MIHQASGKDLAKPLWRPDVESFSQCFDLFKPYDLFGNKPHAFAASCIRCKSLAASLWNAAQKIMGRGDSYASKMVSVSVGPFCKVESPEQNKYFSVVCAPWILSSIAESGAVIPNVQISFEVIDHKNGWSLVLATMGGYTPFWLAYIRNETIPA